MSSYQHESQYPLPEQAHTIEEMQMEHAQVLIESGLARKVMMHIVERTQNPSIESGLLSGLPLVLESSNSSTSILFVGIRFLDDEAGIRTKIVPIGRRDIGSAHYQPHEISRFDISDCLLVEGLVDQVKQIKETQVPNYSLEFGVLYD